MHCPMTLVLFLKIWTLFPTYLFEEKYIFISPHTILELMEFMQIFTKIL